MDNQSLGTIREFTEAYEIFETGKCGSYFADMISQAISEARKIISCTQNIRIREMKKI